MECLASEDIEDRILQVISISEVKVGNTVFSMTGLANHNASWLPGKGKHLSLFCHSFFQILTSQYYLP